MAEAIPNGEVGWNVMLAMNLLGLGGAAHSRRDGDACPSLDFIVMTSVTWAWREQGGCGWRLK